MYVEHLPIRILLKIQKKTNKWFKRIILLEMPAGSMFSNLFFSSVISSVETKHVFTRKNLARDTTI